MFQEISASFFPVAYNSLFPLIIGIDNLSISDHRPVPQYLKRAGLIQDHTVILGHAQLQKTAFIIPHFTQNLSFPDHIAGLFKGIPQPVPGSVLITDICNIQRIISSVILFPLINSQMTENIPDISSCRAYFFTGPGSHTAPLNKNTGYSLRSRIVISAP